MAMSAQITNTYDVSEAIGVREDLSPVIERIDPTEVPFLQNARKGTAKNTNVEWQVQELQAAAATAQPEGFETSFVAATPTVRHSNQCQILARSYIVSGSLDAVDAAGRAKESAYQKILKGLELRRDVETALTAINVKVTSDPRELAGFPVWLTNVDMGGAGGVAYPGDGTAGSGAVGADETLAFSQIDTVLEACYTDGGMPKMFMLTPALKRAFSGLGTSTLATSNQYNSTEIKDFAYIGSISVYLSDFGRLELSMNRFMPAKAGFFIDPRHYEVRTLPGRSFAAFPLARTGDAEKGHILWEGTLVVNAPKAHGGIFGQIP